MIEARNRVTTWTTGTLTSNPTNLLTRNLLHIPPSQTRNMRTQAESNHVDPCHIFEISSHPYVVKEEGHIMPHLIQMYSRVEVI